MADEGNERGSANRRLAYQSAERAINTYDAAERARLQEESFRYYEAAARQGDAFWCKLDTKSGLQQKKFAIKSWVEAAKRALYAGGKEKQAEYKAKAAALRAK